MEEYIRLSETAEDWLQTGSQYLDDLSDRAGDFMFSGVDTIMDGIKKNDVNIGLQGLANTAVGAFVYGGSKATSVILDGTNMALETTRKVSTAYYEGGTPKDLVEAAYDPIYDLGEKLLEKIVLGPLEKINKIKKTTEILKKLKEIPIIGQMTDYVLDKVKKWVDDKVPDINAKEKIHDWVFGPTDPNKINPSGKLNNTSISKNSTVKKDTTEKDTAKPNDKDNVSGNDTSTKPTAGNNSSNGSSKSKNKYEGLKNIKPYNISQPQ